MKLPSIRRIALAVGIAMCIRHGLVLLSEMPIYGDALPRFPVNFLPTLIWAIWNLMLLPMPLLFMALYFTDSKPTLSRRQRPVALLVAAILGYFAITSGIRSLVLDSSHMLGFGMYQYPVRAEVLWAWLKQPLVLRVVTDIADLGEGITIALFAVALYAAPRESQSAAPVRRAVKIIAIVAMILTGAIAVSAITRITYAAFHSPGNGYVSPFEPAWSPGWFFLRNWTYPLPDFCWALLVWLIWSGLKRPRVSTEQVETAAQFA